MYNTIIKSLMVIFLGVLIFALITPFNFAQRDQIHISQLDYSNFPNFNLYVSVLNSVGKPMPGLNADNFVIKENNIEQAISSVIPALE